MPTLIVRRPMDFPSFGASKWRKQDHDTPLMLQLAQARALIYLEEEKYGTKRDVIVFPDGRLELHYDHAPSELLRGLSSLSGAIDARPARRARAARSRADDLAAGVLRLER